MSDKIEPESAVAPELLEILVCPACRSALAEHEVSLQCLNPECRLRYRVDDGIPILLIDEAEEVPPDRFTAMKLPMQG